MKHIVLFLGLTVSTSASLAMEMPQRAKELGCNNCHSMEQKVVGPSWMDISKRYRDMRNSQVVFDQLVKKIAKGGSGNWGDLPMVANDPAGTKHDSIVELVKFILAVSDQSPENRAELANRSR